MKRDLELVEKILLHCEQRPEGHIEGNPIIEGYDDHTIAYHVHIMTQGGLVDSWPTLSRKAPAAVLSSIRWQGYEFLAERRKLRKRADSASKMPLVKDHLPDTDTALTKEIVSKWKNTRYLCNVQIDDEEKLAILLENQSRYNAKDWRHNETALVLVSRVFSHVLDWNLIPIQPLLSSDGWDYTRQIEATICGVREVVEARTRILRTRITEDIAAWRTPLVSDIKNEIFREITSDIRTCARKFDVTSHKLEDLDSETVLQHIDQANSLIDSRTGRQSDRWIVTDLHTADLLAPNMCDYITVVSKIEKRPEFTIFVDPLFPRGEILCGAYDPMLKGYVYLPQTPFLMCDIDERASHQGAKLRTQYAKKLLSPDPYVRISYNK